MQTQATLKHSLNPNAKPFIPKLAPQQIPSNPKLMAAINQEEDFEEKQNTPDLVFRINTSGEMDDDQMIPDREEVIGSLVSTRDGASVHEY